MHPTPCSIVAVDDRTGECTIFNVVTDRKDASPDRSLDIPISIEPPDVILADGHEPETSLLYLAEHPGAASVVDAGTYREDTYEVARNVDLLVCSEDFAEQYSGARLVDPDDLAGADFLLAQIEHINGGVAVITLGDRGLIYRDQVGDPCHMPAFPAACVDTTGAGDVFHGAFAQGLYSGLSLERNLARASMAASIAVRSMGGLSSIPALKTVMEELS